MSVASVGLSRLGKYPLLATTTTSVNSCNCLKILKVFPVANLVPRVSYLTAPCTFTLKITFKLQGNKVIFYLSRQQEKGIKIMCSNCQHSCCHNMIGEITNQFLWLKIMLLSTGRKMWGGPGWSRCFQQVVGSTAWKAYSSIAHKDNLYLKWSWWTICTVRSLWKLHSS